MENVNFLVFSSIATDRARAGIFSELQVFQTGLQTIDYKWIRVQAVEPIPHGVSKPPT